MAPRLLYDILPENKKVLVINYDLSKILDTLHLRSVFVIPDEKFKLQSYDSFEFRPVQFESEYERNYITFYYGTKNKLSFKSAYSTLR
jgi:hypothetical protein